MNLKAQILKFESEAWSYYLAIPKKVGESFIECDNKRVKCIVEGVVTIHTGLMPKGDVL